MRFARFVAAGLLWAGFAAGADLPGVVDPSEPPSKPPPPERPREPVVEPAKPPPDASKAGQGLPGLEAAEPVQPPREPAKPPPVSVEPKPKEPAKPPPPAKPVRPPETPPPDVSKTPGPKLPPRPGPEGLRQKALEILGDPRSEPRDRYEACAVLTLFDDPQTVEALRKVARSDPENEVRVAAIFGLGQMARVEAAPDLVSILSEKSPRLRMMAAAQLGFIADPSTAKSLVGVLADASPDVRAAAATSLGRMRAEEGFEPVLKLLRDVNPQVRAEAASAAGRFRNPKAVDPLLALLKDPDPRPRVQALRGLLRQPEERVVKTALALRKDPDEGVRLSLMELLGVAQAFQGEGREVLFEGLADSDAGVRAAAIQALAGSGDPEAGKRIAKLLSPRAESLPGVRMAAAASLAQFRTLPEAGEALAAALGDYDDRVRAVATASFGWFPESIAIPAMQKSLDDPSSAVRSGAATALSRFKARKDVQEAIAAFEKRETRMQAAPDGRPRRTFLDDNTF